MNYFTEGQKATRNDTGAVVRIVDVRPVGDQVFYVTWDYRDGHTAIINGRDLRPHTQEAK
jgi:hypothetical protein